MLSAGYNKSIMSRSLEIKFKVAMLSIFLLLTFVDVLATPTRERNFSVYETAESIEYNGYPAETHHATTSDGYILEMHRIPHGKNQDPTVKRPVVFLMHGLMAASNCYVILGPEHAMAYNLADAGFDIWMGNARGNRNSRCHDTMNPDDPLQKKDFFDFTWEEIALHDLPAMIDYVLEYTGQKKLHYIGHSQGGTAFLVVSSMRPEFNEKFASAHLLAGVGYQNYFPNSQLASLARLTNVIYNAAVLNGFVEVFPPGFEGLPLGQGADYSAGNGRGLPLGQGADYCAGDGRYNFLCELVEMMELMADDTTDVATGDMFGAASLKQIAHFGQNIRDKSFRRWSYGTIQNLRIYGSRNPPVYDLSLITVNVTMHYTVSDNLLDERDVIAMANVMPNTVVRKVARDTFLHVDFVAARDAKELVTDYIAEALRAASQINGL